MAARLYSVTNNWRTPIDLPVAGSIRLRRIDPGVTVTDRFILSNRRHILRWIRSRVIDLVEVVGDEFYVFLVDENDDFLVDGGDNYLVAG